MMTLSKLTLFTAVVLLLMNVRAAAADIEREQMVQPDGIVKIKSLRGRIRVEGWDKNKVRIEGDLDELSTGLRFDVKSTRTEIEIEMPSGNVNWGDGSDLLIQVPTGNRVIIDGVSLDVYATGLLAGMQIRTISGEIDVATVRQKISVKTVSGEIHVEDSQGDLRASSASGEIRVKHHMGSATLETMSGEIDFDGGELSEMRSSTMSGQIEIESKLSEAANVEVSSVSGQISFRIDQPNNLTIVANTMSGQIDNDLTDDQVRESFGQKSLDAQLGTGSSRIKLRAVSGAIELEEG